MSNQSTDLRNVRRLIFRGDGSFTVDPAGDWVSVRHYDEALAEIEQLRKDKEINTINAATVLRLESKYQRAVWFLQDIAAMSRKVGSETAAHALAQLGEPRQRDDDDVPADQTLGKRKERCPHGVSHLNVCTKCD